MSVYFDRQWNEMVYQNYDIFPEPSFENLVIGVDSRGSTKPFSAMMSRDLPDYELISKGQHFPLYLYEKVDTSTPDELDLTTTDPEAALGGSMVPMGEAKGAALALMVEVLAAALTGGRFGFEASSFLNAEGPPPDVGQLLIAVDIRATAGEAFLDRMETLAETMLAQEGVRLPGSSRLARREAAAREGVALSDATLAELRALAD